MSFRYPESPKLSADYLRRALPLMSKLGVAMNPANYAVFYNYVAGKDDDLLTEVDSLLQKGARLTREQSDRLFKKYFSQFDDAQVERFQSKTRIILNAILKALGQADKDTSQYGRALGEYNSQLESDPDEQAIQQIIEGLLSDTSGMQRSYVSLQKQLNESTEEVENLRKALRSAREEALLDPLTALANRKGFMHALKRAVTEIDEAANPPCLLMVDIDHFKRVNDTYGHVLGDTVLKLVAATLVKCVKGKDTASRYGGEEFAILLPDTPLTGAQQLAETIRSAIEHGKIQRSGSQEPVGNITVSVGVASFKEKESIEQFIKRADAALYQSKNRGRNRVTVSD